MGNQQKSRIINNNVCCLRTQEFRTNRQCVRCCWIQNCPVFLRSIWKRSLMQTKSFKAFSKYSYLFVLLNTFLYFHVWWKMSVILYLFYLCVLKLYLFIQTSPASLSLTSSRPQYLVYIVLSVKMWGSVMLVRILRSLWRGRREKGLCHWLFGIGGRWQRYWENTFF